MNPAALCRMLYEHGMRIESSGESLIVRPAAKLTPELRDVLLQHKPAILTFLADARATTAAILGEAMKVCDEFGDGPQARADMRRDCKATPQHLVGDLLQHFRTRKGAKQ